MTHDCICTYTHNGIASVRMEVGGRYEIEYSVVSLKRYCSSWLGRIFVVGSEPPASIKDDVIHIPCSDIYKHFKDSNIIHKIRTVIETVPDLTDEFCHFSDDYIVTKETAWDDLTPRVKRRWSDWTEEKWKRNALTDFWHRNLVSTLRLFGKDAAFFEPHIFSPMDKHKFLEMCGKFDYTRNCYVFKSLYYNYVGAEQVPVYDICHLSRGKAKEMVQSLDPDHLPRFLTWTDPAFVEKKFRDILEKTVFGC